MEYHKTFRVPLGSNLFFYENDKTLFSISQDRLHISGVHNAINLHPYTKYFAKNIDRAALDNQKETLLIQSKPKVLYLLGVKAVCTSKIKLKADIIGFFFSTPGNKLWDLGIVTDQGFFTYKLDQDLKPTPKSFINIPISSYMKEMSLEYLLAISSNSIVLISLLEKKFKKLTRVEIGSNIAKGPATWNLINYIQPELDCKIVIIGSFHGKIYLIALDGFSGTLDLYTKDGIKTSFPVEPGAYNIRVIDNLIILHNFGLQESTIIDRLEDPIIIKVNHRGNFELNPTFIQLLHQYSYDPSTQQLLELTLYPKNLVESHPNASESIIFLLRRDKGLQDGLNLLKQSILQEKSIESVIQRIVSQRDNIISVLQSQIYNQVLLPCFKEIQNYKFLVKILLVYIKELIFSNLAVELDIQVLTLKVLIKSNEILLLQNLVSFHIIDDCKEIALLMIDLGKRRNFYYGFLLGIDMLQRMKLTNLVMDHLIEHGEFYETMHLLSERPCPGYDLGKVNRETSDMYTRNIIQEFLKENIY